MSRITQFATGHAYTGEYYKDFVKSNSTICPCSDSGLYPPVFHSRDHVLKACPLFELHRVDLRTKAPRLDNVKWPSGNLLRPQYIEDLIAFFFKSGALSKGHAPKAREPP